ncbi:MAG: hypothetical protein ABSB70_01360 [Candidatus Velthaea sp.]
MSVCMHDLQRHQFSEGLRVDIVEGATDADRGDLVDLNDVIREFRDENATIAKI